MASDPEYPPNEYQEQCALLQWAELQIATGLYPELRWLYAVPNGGERNVIVATRMKAEGVKSGVPDLCLPVPRGSFHGLYLEMKCRRKSSRVKKAQHEWLNYLESAGYCVGVAYHHEAAEELLRAYLQLSKPGEEL